MKRRPVPFAHAGPSDSCECSESSCQAALRPIADVLSQLLAPFAGLLVALLAAPLGVERIILLLAVLTTLIGAAAMCWFVSPRLAGSISPENWSDEYQHRQDFQPSQQHSNGEQPFGGVR